MTLYALRQREIAMLEVGIETLKQKRNEIALEIESLSKVICWETVEENGVSVAMLGAKVKELGDVVRHLEEAEIEMRGLR